MKWLSVEFIFIFIDKMSVSWLITGKATVSTIEINSTILKVQSQYFYTWFKRL